MRRKPAATLLLVTMALSACASGRAESPSPGPPGAPEAAGAVRPFRFGTPDILLLVTDSTNGVMEPCNCPGSMPGGLSRRSGLVRRYREAFPNVVLVDTGDLFRVSHPRDPRNDYILRAYRQIGYDAVVLQDHEWSAEPEALRRLVTAGGPEFLSTTATLAGAPALPVTREVKRSFGAARIAILSDAPRSSPPLLQPETLGRLSLAPQRRLAEAVARLKREGHVVVIASHGVDAEVASLAKACAPDLALQGHFPTGNLEPERLRDPPIVRVGDYEIVTVFAWKVRGGRPAGFEYRREVIDDRWPRDEEIWKTYEASTRDALSHVSGTKIRDGKVYTPSAKCGECHEPQFAAWKASRHARAWATLEKVGRQGDPDCISCHTTGFPSAAGFDSMRTTPELANVNCQDCHLFSMQEHDVPGFSAKPVEPASCVRCHTSTTDPRFDFAARREEAGCGR